MTTRSRRIGQRSTLLYQISGLAVTVLVEALKHRHIPNRNESEIALVNLCSVYMINYASLSASACVVAPFPTPLAEQDQRTIIRRFQCLRCFFASSCHYYDCSHHCCHRQVRELSLSRFDYQWVNH